MTAQNEPRRNGFHSDVSSRFNQTFWGSATKALPVFSEELPLELQHQIPMTSSAEELLQQCAAYMTADDVNRVREAYEYARAAHKGQFRKSGEPYITHPVSVASILADFKVDPVAIMAALMHDVLEDTGVSKSEMAARFGSAVTEVVDGVSKLDKLKFSSVIEAHAESFRKMLLAMSRDVRVILVKLADRLHNMRTLGIMRPEKRRRIGLETMEIYVPIANRLGIYPIFRELQDLAFANIYPRRYQILTKAVHEKRAERREKLHSMLVTVRRSLAEEYQIPCSIGGREKSTFAIYRKMRNKHLSFSEVPDVYGFRVIVQSRMDCYRALGALHATFKPVEGRFKDMIAIPKSNGYQSLHTTVISPSGEPVEFQIRSVDMDRLDEYGLLAHRLFQSTESMDNLDAVTNDWLQSLLDIGKHSGDSNEFLENVKADLFADRVYVFTPKGKIISVPQHSTVVDFAYQLHTDIGNQAIGCTINEEEKPLSTVLSNGDRIVVLTDKKSNPDPAWLAFVHSGKARAEIRQYLRTLPDTEQQRRGLKLLISSARQADFDLGDINDRDWATIARQVGSPSSEQLFRDIGTGKTEATAVIRRLVLHRLADESRPQASGRLILQSNVALVTNLAPCCGPLPGDEVLVYRRKGSDVEIHLASCPVARKGLKNDPEHWSKAEWGPEDKRLAYPVRMRIEVDNLMSSVAEISNAVAINGAAFNILSIKPVKKTHNRLVLLQLQVHNRAQMLDIVHALRTIQAVKTIVRLSEENIDLTKKDC